MLGIGPHSSFLFFLPYSQRSQIGCLRQFYTWCRLSTNLECTSEICCMRLAENTGHKKSPKIRHLCTIAQVCRAISSQLRHLSTSGKKLSHSNISSTCLHNMVNFGPLTAEICWRVWFGAPQHILMDFTSCLRYYTSVTERERERESLLTK